MKAAFSRFLEQLKTRNVRKTLAIYVSIALTTIGVIRVFMEVYGLPSAVFRFAVTLLTVGIMNAFIYAWQRGGTPGTRSRPTAILLHGAFALIGFLLAFNAVKAPSPGRLASGSASVVAVLPFTNLGGDDQEYFSDGMTEDILTQLSKISGLRVISRTSVMQYKNTTKPIREIGRELGAGSILEGSVRRIDNRVRIVGQLIDAETDGHLWAETYDRELKDVFALQGEVARAIAAALKSTLTPNEQALMEKKPTENINAYTLYLKGRQHYYLYTDAGNDSAIAYFRRALTLDPRYALAYAGLGDAFGQRVEKHGYDPAWLDSALAMCTTALSIDDDLAEPYKGRGVVYFVRGQLRQAMAEYARAAEINPNYAPAVGNLGSIYWWTGQYDLALPWLRRNVQLNPRASAYQALGLLYHGLREDSLAELWFRNAMALQPNYTRAGAQLIRVYATIGKLEQARSLSAAMIQQFPNDRVILGAVGDLELLENNPDSALAHYEKGGQDMERAYILWKRGRREEADSLTKGIVEYDNAQIEAGSEEFTPALELARIAAFTEKTGEALAWMEKAVDAGWLYYRLSMVDPLLENIRDEPQFIRIMNGASRRVDEMRSKAKEGLVSSSRSRGDHGYFTHNTGEERIP
jgi:protein kinase/serine/threonine-protein kinase